MPPTHQPTLGPTTTRRNHLNPFTNRLNSPGYLDKATRSLGEAGKVLGERSTDLSSLQQSARDYERQAEQAQRALNQARRNPDLGLANQQFDTEALNTADMELKAIREQATRLYAQHQGTGESSPRRFSHCEPAGRHSVFPRS